MVLIPIAFLILVALGVYYLVTGSVETSRSNSNHHRKAFEILKERFAKGEITGEQFQKMKRELES
jgi:putative membrane protein